MPDPAASAIVHALKYGCWEAVAREMASRMARLSWPRDVIVERNAVLAVPLAPSRERERGFNQSQLLADALATHWDIPTRRDVLQRARATVTQTRLTPSERLSNVAGAFRVIGDDVKSLRGAHVMLVDDVVTTAATLNACAEALLAGGVRILSYVTFGRAPALGDRR
jgi:ComF family protein